MKFKGKKLTTPNIEIIAIPRSNGEDIILKAAAVLDMDDFDKIYPQPVPPKVTVRGGQVIDDVEDKRFLRDVNLRETRRTTWIILQSLKASDIEWETVKLNDPSTWDNYKTELKESGFSVIEVNRIIAGVFAANCLSEDRVEEARKRFLAEQQVLLSIQSSPTAELTIIPSGEPAKE